MIRRGCIELGSRRQASFVQSCQIDPGNLNPITRRRSGNLLPNPLLNFRNGAELHERLHSLSLCDADGMHMTFDQTRHNHLALRIDHASSITDQLFDLCVASDRDENTIANGRGFDD